MLDTIATVDFGLAFHRGPEATLLLLGDSPHFTIVAASDAFLTATGKYRHEIVGLHFFQLVNNNSEARRSLMGWFDPKNQTRPIVPLTFACEKPFLQYQLSPLVDESGFILNAVCQFKKGSIDDYYRLLVDSIKDHAFFLIDQHGTILSWNIGADKMKGYAASEVIGKHFSMFYVSDDIKNDKPRRDLEQALKSGGLQEEGYQLRKDGTKFWANIAISPIFSNDTELSAFTVIVQNIDRQKQDAMKLEEAKKMLEVRVHERTEDLIRSNAELEQFAYIASHDLQTPLRHVTSYVQLLVSKIKATTGLDPKTEKWIRYILKGTQEMRALILDLLEYSRIGRIDIQVSEIKTSNLIAGIVTEFHELINSCGAKINYENIVDIVGIESQLTQLFKNLIDNALKFRKVKVTPEIEIRCEDEGDFVKFFVRDNGIGIESKYSERIFLMFHRLHSVDEFSGTGIGLAICKKVIEFHGGRIGVESAVGEGSTFFFSLPKKERLTLQNRAYQSETLKNGIVV